MAMSRPRKHTGLAPNLYRDPRGRANYYRYKKPDGSFKTFQAPSLAEANQAAEDANSRRHLAVEGKETGRNSLAYLVPRYIEYREEQDPKLTSKSSWSNRRYALQGFAESFAGTGINEITWSHLSTWWHTLSFHQQKLRHAEFRRLFNWLMGESLCQHLTYNPFTTNDDLPRLYVTGQPEKKRMRLTRDAFWTIYDAASHYPGLQIAMGISLITFMREGDICALRWSDNVEGDLLKRVIGKSLNQRGSASAARLQWDVGSHDLLKKLLARARELSMKNYRCPAVISHLPRIRKTGKTKGHACEITPRRLSGMFAECRDSTGLYADCGDRTPPSFHEIRSLAAKLAKDAGYTDRQIQIAMAHENVATTLSYQDEHQLPYADAGVVFVTGIIGREF